MPDPVMPGEETPPLNGKDTSDDKRDLGSSIQEVIDARRASADPETEDTVTPPDTSAAETPDLSATATAEDDAQTGSGAPASDAETPPQPEAEAAGGEGDTDAPAAEGEDADPEAMPEGLSEPAQERFRTLANERNTAIEERDHAVTQYEEIGNMISDAGIDAHGFAELLEYSRRRSSGDYAGALKIIEQHRRTLALELGPDAAGVDLVEGHQDLRQQLERLEITPELAQEQARLREQAALAERRALAAQQQVATQREADHYQADLNQIAGTVEQMERQWSQHPDYEPIAQAVMAKLPTMMRQYPRDQWASQVKLEYESASKLLSGFARRQKPPPTSITGAGSRSSQVAEPVKLEDKIQQRIDQMREGAA